MKKLFALAIISASLFLIVGLTGCTGSSSSSTVAPADGSGTKTNAPADGSGSKAPEAGSGSKPSGGSGTK